MIDRIALIGFGEAGGMFANEFAAAGRSVSVYDILFETAPRNFEDKARRAGVRLGASPKDAVREAQLIISAVTATSAQAVAREYAPLLKPEQWFLDINSVAPQTKRENARVIEAGGARFVEAAVMAPVYPLRIEVPILLGGARCRELASLLTALGMNVEVASEQIGVASAIKMCRSIWVKGLEALAVEALLAARRYGAEEAMLKSLGASYPSLGFVGQLPDYLVGRVAQHGRRRAAELREVAKTLEDVELEPIMALAIARRQDALVDAMEEKSIAFDASREFSWRELADRLAADG